MARVVLVLPTATYRAPDFLDAARALGVEVVVASEEVQALASTMGDRFVRVDLCDPEAAGETVASAGARPDAVVGVDEQGVLVASYAAARLGFPHNPPEAVAITRDKRLLRETLTSAGLRQPRVDPDTFPRVVKATTLSGSRGVIRADDEGSFHAAVARVRAIADSDVLVEEYVPGAEVAVEGLLHDDRLDVLALFDKPDPLEGPYFEETIYVTPSRLSSEMQALVAETVHRACEAIGLREGPIHAEVRIPPEGDPVLLEVAARSIGGLCSRALRFGAGISLEEVILRHALGLDLGDLKRTTRASGVMMIPIPRSGTLRAIEGTDVAREVHGIEGIEITIPVGQQVQALPEGDRYLGFIFAAGERPEDVEHALRDAHANLRIEID
jgi:biotin carboxylase